MSTTAEVVESESVKKVRFKEKLSVRIYFVEESNRLRPTPNFTKRSKPSTINEAICQKLESSHVNDSHWSNNLNK